MGLLEKSKLQNQSVLPNNNKNIHQVNGSKKESYSISNQDENLDPQLKDKHLTQIKISHDNPAFIDSEPCLNPFEIELNTNQINKKEHNQLTDTYTITSSTAIVYITSQNATQSQTSTPKSNKSKKEGFELSGISCAEKLAAAAAAAVSNTVDTVVEIPNFGEELSTMMQQNRMDEIEITSKKFDSKITQAHGFTFGEGNSIEKTYTKTANNMSTGSTAGSDDDPNLKLTTSSSSDIRIRRRRACQLKTLAIFLAIVSAGIIGCIFSFYFMKYKIVNETYFNFTRNMVNERSSKFGSNKLEIHVPFNSSSLTELSDKSVLINKIQEIVMQTFIITNKTVEVIQLDELNEISLNSFIAKIDVELKDATEFSMVPLVIVNEKQVKLAETSILLRMFRQTFKNLTLGLNLNSQNLKIFCDKIDIFYDLNTLKTSDNAHLFTNSTHVYTSFVPTVTKTNQQEISSDYKLAPTVKIEQSTSILSELIRSFSLTLTTETTPETSFLTEKQTESTLITTSKRSFNSISTTSTSTSTITTSTSSSSNTTTTTSTSTSTSTTSTSTTTTTTSTSTSTTTTSTSSSTTSTSTSTTTTITTTTESTSTTTKTISTTVFISTTTPESEIILLKTTTESETTPEIEIILLTTSENLLENKIDSQEQTISSTTKTEESSESTTMNPIEFKITSGVSRLFGSTSNIINVNSVNETQSEIKITKADNTSTKNDDSALVLKLLKNKFKAKEKELIELLNKSKKNTGVLVHKTNSLKNKKVFVNENDENVKNSNENSSKELLVDLIFNNKNSVEIIDTEENQIEEATDVSSSTLRNLIDLVGETTQTSTLSTETTYTTQSSDVIRLLAESESDDKNQNDIDVLLEIDDKKIYDLSKILQKLTVK